MTVEWCRYVVQQSLCISHEKSPCLDVFRPSHWLRSREIIYLSVSVCLCSAWIEYQISPWYLSRSRSKCSAPAVHWQCHCSAVLQCTARPLKCICCKHTAAVVVTLSFDWPQLLHRSVGAVYTCAWSAMRFKRSISLKCTHFTSILGVVRQNLQCFRHFF